MLAHPSHPMSSSTCAISISRSPLPMLPQTGPVLTPSQNSWLFTSQSKVIRRKHGVGICIRCEAVPLQQVDDGYYMRRCVDIARKGMGHTSPNPMVGCVIVKGGTIVGEGFHPKAGQPHAEVFALRNAGDLAESATAYVSLEPCNHFGRTPPCTEALIKSKVKKVVVGMVDPNPIVASKGIDRLRDAGIDVTVGIEEGLCKKLNEAYIHTMLTGKPFGALRYSLSMNGCLLDRLGEGVSATGGYFSRLLNEYDAVISFPISSADQVLFLASQEPGASQPFQILVARNPCPPIQIPVPANESTSKVIIFTDNPAAVAPEISQRGMEVVVSDLLNLDVIMEYCMRRGLCSVVLDLRGTFSDFKDLVDEGIGQNLVQKIIVEVLPVWDGSESGGSSFSALESIGRRQVKDMALSAVISGRSAVLEGYLG